MAKSRVVMISAQGAEREVTLASLATPDVADRARADTNAWIKRLRLVQYNGVSMRERFRYRNDSLWWFTELYLQKMRQLDQAVLTVLALDAAIERHGPTRLLVKPASAATAAAARAFGLARAIPVDVQGEPQSPSLFWPGAQVGVTAALSRARKFFGPPVKGSRSGSGQIAAFVHTAFWRGNEGYIGPVLDALSWSAPAALRLVGVGPQRNFTLRRWWDPVASEDLIAGSPITPVEAFAPWSSLRDSVALWKERSALADALVGGDAIRAAATIHGCDLWPVLQHELRGVAEVQWPWSARAMDEAGAAIDVLKCQMVVTYAEAGGWGRALMLEARRRNVRSVGVQHGFIYRHWLNYRHEPDEMQPVGPDRGFPAPDKTLLFDRFAEAHLLTEGAFPADRLLVTGSASRDNLVSRVTSVTPADRESTRAAAGATRPKQKLAVLAAKFTEIRDVLPALVAAIRTDPDVQLAIKSHPAETGAVYTPIVGDATNITVLEADADLAGLLAAADVLVTRNSTVAIDALLLGLPALVIGQPSNLSPFVDEGVMVGPERPHGNTEGNNDEAGIRQALQRLLYDREVQARVRAATESFVERYDMKARGTAAARAAGAILEMTPR